jgi:hypothetical protein
MENKFKRGQEIVFKSSILKMDDDRTLTKLVEEGDEGTVLRFTGWGMYLVSVNGMEIRVYENNFIKKETFEVGDLVILDGRLLAHIFAISKLNSAGGSIAVSYIDDLGNPQNQIVRAERLRNYQYLVEYEGYSPKHIDYKIREYADKIDKEIMSYVEGDE